MSEQSMPSERQMFNEYGWYLHDRLKAARHRTARRLRDLRERSRTFRDTLEAEVVLHDQVIAERDEARAALARAERERERCKAALEAIRISPKAVVEWLEATHPDVARRLTIDDLGTGTGDIVRAGAAAALFGREREEGT